MAKAKVLPDYTHKRWNSLTDLKDKIEKDGKEKIVNFNGYKLITDKRVFGLYDGILSVRNI